MPGLWRRKGFRRVSIGLGAVLLVAVLIVLLADTALVKRPLLAWAGRKLESAAGWKLRAGGASLRLLGLSATLRDVSLVPVDPEAGPLRAFAAKEIEVDLAGSAVFTRSLRIERARILQPRLELSASAALGAKPGAVEPKPAAPRTPSRPVPFRIGRLDLVDGEIVTGDAAPPFRISIEGISLGLEGVSETGDGGGVLEWKGGRAGGGGFEIALQGLTARFRANAERIALDGFRLATSLGEIEALGGVRNLRGRPELDLDVAAMLSLGDAARLAAPDLEARGGLTVKGRVEGPVSEVRYSGSARTTGLALSGIPVTEINADFSGQGGTLRLGRLSVGTPGGTIVGSGELGASGSSLALAWTGFRLDGIAAATPAFPFIPLAASDGRVEAAWGASFPESLRGSGSAAFRALDAGPGSEARPGIPVSGSLDFRGEAGGIEIVRSGFAAAGINLELAGRVGVDKKLGGRFRAEIPSFAETGAVLAAIDPVRAQDVARFAPGGISGGLLATGSVTGSLGAPRAALELQAPEIVSGDLVVRSLRAAVRLDRSAVEIPSLTAEIGGGSLRAQGRFALPGPGDARREEGRAEISLENLDIAGAAGFAPEKLRTWLQGRLSATAVLTGSPDRFRLEAEASAVPLGPVSAALGAVTASASYESGGLAVLKSLRADIAGGSIAAAGSIDLGSRAFEASLRGEGIDLARLDSLLPRPGPWGGRLSFEADGRGAPERPVFTFKLQGSGLSSRVLEIPFLRAEASCDGRTAKAEMTAGDAGLSVTAGLDLTGPRLLTAALRADSVLLRTFLPAEKKALAGESLTLTAQGALSWPLASREGLTAELRFSGLDLGAAAALFPSAAMLQIGGEAAGRIAAHGNPADPARFEVEGEIGTLVLAAGRVAFRNPRPIAFDLKDRTFSLCDFRLESGGSYLEASGSVGALEREPVLAARLRAELDASLVPPEVAGAVLAGRVALDVAADGALARPRLSGRGSIDSGFASLQAIPLVLSDVEAELAFDGSSIAVAGGRGLANGGSVKFSGKAGLGSPPGAVDARFEIEADRVPLRYPDGLLTVSSGRGTISGDGRSWLLEGRLRLLEGSFREDVYPGAEILGLSSLPLPAPSVDIPELFHAFRLDLRVVTANPLVVRNNIASLDLETDLAVAGTLAVPIVTGRVRTAAVGEIVFNERTFTVERAELDFPGRTPPEPVLDLVAHADVPHAEETLDVRLQISGPASRLNIDLTSTPARSREDLALLLMTGRTLEEVRGSALDTLGQQMILYFATPLASPITRTLERLLRIQDISFQPLTIAAEEDPGVRLTFRKDISDRASVVYSLDMTSTQRQTWLLDYALSRRFTLRAFRKDDGDYGGSFRNTFTLGGGSGAERRRGPGGRGPDRVTAVVIRGEFGEVGEAAAGRKLKALLPKGELRLSDAGRAAEGLAGFFAGRGYAGAALTTRLEPDGDGVRAVIEVRAGTPARIVFRGDPIRRRLKDAVRSGWTGKIPEALNIEEARRTLLRDLKRRRHAAAEVEIETASSVEGKTYVFTLRAGERFRIRDFRVLGRAGLSAEEIRTAVSRYPGARQRGLWNLVNEPEAALLSARKLYRERGFRSAVVHRPNLALDRGAKSIDVTLEIEEGPQSRVASLSFAGNSLFEDGELRAALALKEGDPLSPALLRQDQTSLLDLYRGRGYKAAELDVAVLPEAEGPDVSIAYTIREGERRVIGDIEVGAAGRAGPRFIERAAGFREGTPVTMEALAEGQKRLYDTGVFRNVSILSEPLPGAGGREKVRIETRPQPPFSVAWGLRYSDRDAFEGFGELEVANLLGGGRKALLSYRQNAFLQDARVSVASPYLFGARANLLLSLSAVREEREGFTTEETRWSVRSRLGLPLKFTLTGVYRWSRVHVFESVPSGPFTFDFLLHLSEVSALIIRDSRDDALDPRRGLFFSTALTYSPEALGTDLAYVSAVVQLAAQVPFGPGWVWAAGMKVGAADAYGQILISSRRFFAGGGTSVRGFGQDELGPRDFLGRPEGGEAVVILNQELRFPIWKAVWGGVFLDAGNVFAGVREARLSDLRAGAGIGLRFRSPVGLLRVDWGFNLVPQPGEPRSVLYFSLGQAF